MAQPENLSVEIDVDRTDLTLQAATAHQKISNHTDQEALFLEGTMSKVFSALMKSGLTRDQALDGLTEMQNAGILFRERFKL